MKNFLIVHEEVNPLLGLRIIVVSGCAKSTSIILDSEQEEYAKHTSNEKETSLYMSLHIRIQIEYSIRL